MKRIISILLALALVICLVPTALAAAPESCGENATWTLKDGVLTISGTGAVARFAVDSPWVNNPDIRELVIEEGITELTDLCFYYMPNLQKVTFPDSLYSIGSQVFQGCDKLEQITLPKNLQYIKCAASSFSGESLQAVYVHPDNQRFYSDNGVLIDRVAQAVLCYPMAKADAEYTVPEGIRQIAYGAFWFAQAQAIYLPQGLKTIGDSAFYAASITSIEIPDTVTYIETMAFANCDCLQQATVPQSVQQVRSDAFASCMALETLTFLNPQCLVANRGNTLESTTLLRGYLDSSIHTYAQRYGRRFQDVETGTLYNYDRGNTAYIELLPQQTNSTLPSFISISMASNVTGKVSGYQPFIVLERDPSHATYQEMLTFVNDLTADCISDYEKAYVISRWVNQNMTYVFGMMGGGVTAEGVYSIWRNRRGNCEGYTQLTNFMLHLAGIPNATVTSYAHTWTAAQLDGRWVMIDSTNNIFDESPDTFDPIERICFTVNDNLVCVIDDLLDVKLASYGLSVADHEGIEEITIPSYVTFIYDTALITYTSNSQLHDLTIRGTAGSYAEDYIRQNLPNHSDITYQDGMFTARGHIYSDDVDGSCNICGVHRETMENRTVMHMFRMYDPNSGEHFYTGSEVERDNLVAAGWNYEGVGFTFSMTTGAPVYRLYDRYDTFEHLYTMDVEERDRLVADGWELEGIAFNSAYDTEVPQYRLHNPNETRGAYHFTASEEERDALISAGWEYQGIGFYSSWK